MATPLVESNQSDERLFSSRLWNKNWQFFRSDNLLSVEQAGRNTQWQRVSLPHSAKLEPRIVNNQWQGDAWYRKSFSTEPQWQDKQVFLDFEAAMNVAEVWLNGEKIHQHQGGYLPFSVLLNPHLSTDSNNELLLRLDNRDNEITGPKPLHKLDFNMYGGIYRNVWLRVESKIHISNAVAANKVASGGIFVRYPQVGHDSARVEVQTHVVNAAGENTQVTVRQQLLKDNRLLHSLSSELSLAGNSDGSISQTFQLSSPELWSPSKPSLYRIKTQVINQGQIVDEELTRIGIRKFEFVNNVLHINGEQTFLRGVNRHQEYPYVGYALSDAAQYRDAEKIKAAGFDYVRLSHYPHSKAFMRAADELGLVVLNAILGWQFVNDTPEFHQHAVQTCRDLIRRDRNHASVIAWECSLNESAMSDTLVNDLHRAVHEECPSETTYSAGWLAQTYDIYLQARQHRIKHFEEPGKPYVVSEYGDWEYYAMNAGLNQDSWSHLLPELRSSRQLLRHGEQRLQQQSANIMEAHNDNFSTPAFADGYWAMFDYNRGYANDLEASGIMSLERLPKFSYYFYQSQREATAFAGPLAGGYMVYIASYWQADSSLRFYVYSNAQELELFLNGRSLGKGVKDTEHFPHLEFPPFLFNLKAFEAGELEARGLVNGKVVAKHRVVTPGKPASLVLTLDKSALMPQRGVNDLVFVHAQILDEQGHPTRINDQPVAFSVKGDAKLISPREVNVEAGTAVALVKIGDILESIQIDATFGDMQAKTLVLGSTLE